MKRVKDTLLFKEIREIREYHFGTFYFFEGLVISEINKGAIFNWKMAKRGILAAREIFGPDIPIGYISNRYHSYYVLPTDWIKFYRNRRQIDFYGVVGTTTGSTANWLLERLFFGRSLKKFNDLESAITWSLGKIKVRQLKNKGTDLSADMK